MPRAMVRPNSGTVMLSSFFSADRKAVTRANMRKYLCVLSLLVATNLVWAQRVLTTPDFSGFTGRDGVGEAAIKKLLPLPDGGALVVGTFDVWYEGLRFRDLLKLRADGNPDTSWRVALTYPETAQRNPKTVYDASVTPTGVFVTGGFDTINGVAVNGGAPPYLSLASGQLLNAASVGAVSNLQFFMLSNLDKSADRVYVQTENALRRVSAGNGQVDPAWFFKPTVFGSESLLADSAGGLWNTGSETSFMLTSHWANRYALAGASAIEPAPTVQPQKIVQDAVVAGIAGDYVYAGTARYRKTDGELAPFWLTATPPSHISEKYAYFPTAPAFTPSGIVRAPTSGNGTPESWLFPDAAGYVIAAEQAFYPWPTPGEPDNLGVIKKKSPADGVTYPSVLIVKEDLVGNEDPTVVEYYVPALKRYFITGRKNEQAALDAQLQSFTRTGMRFAAKSSRYRDIPEQPVCRMYASPDKGGSNSHFYGVGADCPTLNKLSGLKYEAFDFSVLKPVNATCSAAAPNPVWRLFNNKVATNDGNHRYVVSAATKAAMIAQGWIDEGAVFCSTGVVDAAN